MRSKGKSVGSTAVEAPAIVRHIDPADFQRDLGRYWRHVRKVNGLPITRQGWIYKSAFKALCHALNAADLPPDEQLNPRLMFMRSLLESMHALRLGKDERHLVANPNSELFSLPMARRIQRAFESWCDSPFWDDLTIAAQQLSGNVALFGHRALLFRGRQALLGAIKQAAATNTNNWIPLSALMPQTGHLLFSHLAPGDRFPADTLIRASFSGSYNEARMKDLEHAFVAGILSGPLHWMGLVELGYSCAPAKDSDPPSAFRLTPAGAWLLANGAQPEFAEHGGRLIVQPNFTLLALEPISDVVLSEIDHFAELQSDDRAVTYRLTREALYRGQQSGWSAARVIAFLESHQGGPLPANVRRSLEEWEAAHRRITIHRAACVVQFADTATEQALIETLAPFDPQALGGHFYLLAGASEDIAHALRQAGWPPLVQTNAEAGSALRVSDDGEVTFNQPTPSVYVLGQLAPFAELSTRADGSVQARLTEKSVRAAMSADLKIEQLFSTLERLHDGPLPDALCARLRAWGSFYGSASLQQVALLSVADHHVLANLLRDPQIGRFISPIEGSSRPVAVVGLAHLEAVQSRLRALGITLDSPLLS
jgi:hypothetical protein